MTRTTSHRSKRRNIDCHSYYSRLREVLGMSCSRVACTAGVGSMVVLHFGETKPETTTLPSFGSFTFEEGRYQISLDFAAWRCIEGNDLLCSSSSPNGVGSPMEIGLNRLKGRSVRHLELA